jgi:hypothetical protein
MRLVLPRLQTLPRLVLFRSPVQKTSALLLLPTSCKLHYSSQAYGLEFIKASDFCFLSGSPSGELFLSIYQSQTPNTHPQSATHWYSEHFWPAARAIESPPTAAASKRKEGRLENKCFRFPEIHIKSSVACEHSPYSYTAATRTDHS